MQHKENTVAMGQRSRSCNVIHVQNGSYIEALFFTKINNVVKRAVHLGPQLRLARVRLLCQTPTSTYVLLKQHLPRTWGLVNVMTRGKPAVHARSNVAHHISIAHFCFFLLHCRPCKDFNREWTASSQAKPLTASAVHSNVAAVPVSSCPCS
jgi:hypothetical protein